MLLKHVWDNIEQKKCLCSIGPEPTDMIIAGKETYAMLSWAALANIAQNNYPHNAENVDSQSTAWSMLFKYGWDNIVQGSYWCNVGPVDIVIFSQENNQIYSVVLICLSQHYNRKGNYLCNGGPHFTNNFAQKNNLKKTV